MTTSKTAAVAPLSDSQPLSTMSDEMLALTEQDAGAGVSQDPNDIILPRISVLQNSSPVVDARSPDFRDGATPGCFQFHNDQFEFRDGEIGFDAVPIVMETAWLEWGPTRGSGLFGRHLRRPEDAEPRISQEDGNKKSQWVRRGSGNVLQEVREFFVMVDGKPYLMPFHGSGHTTARRLQTYMSGLRHPRTGGIMPAYSHKYHLNTTRQSNSKGHWFGVRFQDRGEVAVPEYLAARELHAIVSRGAFRVEMSDAAAPLQVSAA